MSPVAVVTDSTAYIPPALMPANTVVAPLQVLWDGQSFRDGVDIMPDDFYKRLAKSKTMPSTSQPTPADFLAMYQQLAEQGNDIISIHISSDLSGTIDSAIQARQMMDEPANIEIVDSRLTGMALGFPVLAASQAASEGADLQAVKAVAQRAAENSGVHFVAATLEFLHRGGRIGGGSAFIGKLLDVKPILALSDGKVVAAGKARTRAKSIERMLDLIVAEIGDRRPVHLAALHANAEDAAGDMLKMARERFRPDEVAQAVLADVSPVIGTHLGPGGMGICYMAGV